MNFHISKSARICCLVLLVCPSVYAQSSLKIECEKYMGSAHDAYLMLVNDVKEIVKPSDELRNRLAKGIKSPKGIYTGMDDLLARITTFKKQTSNVSISKYSSNSCPLVSTCNLSSLEISMALLLEYLKKLNRCANESCTISELYALMEFTVPTYDRLVGEFKACNFDKTIADEYE